MDELIKKISDSELLILKLFWESNKEMTMTEIRKSLSKTTLWEASTIKTLLYRLCEKGIIQSQKREVFYYKSLITKNQYNTYATKNIIDKLYEGSAKNLIASLVNNKTLNNNDILELRNMFKVENGGEENA